MKFQFLILFLLVTSLVSCKKGDHGDIGATGPQGLQGIQGPAGSTILNGAGDPSSSIGKVGDFYLNLTTSKLFGPKTASSWGNGTTLKGADGANGTNGTNGSNGAKGDKGDKGADGTNGTNGTNGNKILSGTGTPDATLGVVGDIYLDKNSYSLYGPKTASGWGVATSLQGPAGTANVLYSGWNYATSFNDSTIDNSSLKVGYLRAPSITTSILNSGTVLVYFTYGGGTFPLPYTSNAGGKPNTINYIPMLNKLLFTRFAHDNSNSINLSTLLQYRYIIIPGGTAALSNTPLNDKDYFTIKKLYSIPD